MGFISRLKDKYNHKREVATWQPLSDELKLMYIKAKACEDWICDWGTPTRKELLSKYTSMEGLKFSIKHNIPSVEFFEKNLKGKCEDMGIYINDENAKSVNQETVVLNGSCNADILIDKRDYALYHVHVRHNSIANIRATHGSYVWVKVYGNAAHIKCEVSDGAKIIVFYMNEKGKKVIFKKQITSTNSPYML